MLITKDPSDGISGRLRDQRLIGVIGIWKKAALVLVEVPKCSFDINGKGCDIQPAEDARDHIAHVHVPVPSAWYGLVLGQATRC